MGRQKGSKNKNPKKSVKEVTTYKSAKFLGYCPKCQLVISTLDLENKKIYICPKCDKRANLSTLKKDIPKREVHKDKKEYLESTVNADYHDMPPLRDEDPGELKVAT